MKKLIKLLCVALIALCAAPTALAADGDQFKYGSVTYTIISEADKTCEISLTDANYISGKFNIWKEEKGYRVIGIGKSAFKNCTKLTEIIIPGTIEYIRSYAFNGCRNLDVLRVEAPDVQIDINAFVNTAVKQLYLDCKIINYWFKQNSSIESLTIGNSTKYIVNNAFIACIGLKTVSIGNSVTEIGSAAFNGCSGLTTLSLGSSVAKICGKAFKDCYQLSSIDIPASVTSIESDAFISCGLKNVSFHSIEQLCNISFGSRYSNPIYYSHKFSIGGKDLSEVIIPSTVNKIGNYTFVRMTDLKTVKIPASVESIGDYAFYNCTGVTKVYSYSLLPPVCGEQALNDIDKKICTLYVPAESVDKYKTADQWKDFYNIQAVVEEIRLDKTEATIKVGDELQLTATVLPEEAAAEAGLIWSSSNEKVATVSEAGLVKAVSLGNAKITVTCGYVTATCTVEVTDGAGIDDIILDGEQKVEVYNLQGIRLDVSTREELKQLSSGIYIINGKKVYLK